jgi:hypothetical protein
MYRLEQDGIWYNMDASLLHTAANFGRRARVQLVVRQLLKQNKLEDPMEVALSTTISNTDDARFIFDNHVSPWLNTANKNGFINNFTQSSIGVKFNLERTRIDSLKDILPPEIKML